MMMKKRVRMEFSQTTVPNLLDIEMAFQVVQLDDQILLSHLEDTHP